MSRGKACLVEVVAAVRTTQVAGETVYWLCQRSPTMAWPGKWEYPGGKVEPGETPRQALAREMREEFEAEVTVAMRPMARIIAEDERGVYAVNFYGVTFRRTPTLLEHAKDGWFTVDDMRGVDHLPSGREFSRRLWLEADLTSARGCDCWTRGQMSCHCRNDE